MNKPNLKPLLEKFVLLLILAAAFIVRFIGLKFSYPLLTHPDEPIILNSVFQMAVNQTLDSGSFNRPDQILQNIYLLFLNVASYLKFGESLSVTFLENQLFFYHFARLIVAIIGTMLPLTAWSLGKLAKIDFSIPAALLFAFYPSYVLHSHYITPDILITLLTLLVMLAAGIYIKTGKDYLLILVAFIAAVNTAEKYPGLLSFAIVYSAILLVEINRTQRITFSAVKRFIAISFRASLAYLFSLYIVAPNLFIEYGKTIDAIRFESSNIHLGADNLGWVGNILFYADQFFIQANWLIIALVLIGVAAVIMRREKTLILGAYGILYWLVISMLALHWERWALPMYTTPLLFAAYGCGYLASLHFRRFSLRFPAYLIFGVAAAGLVLFSLSNSIRMTYKDTRYESLQFCRQNGIDEENSFYEGYTPFSPTFFAAPDFDLSENGAATPRYYILSSFIYGRYYQEAQRYPEKVAAYDELKRQAKLIAEFKPTNDTNLSIQEQIDAVEYYSKRIVGFKLADRFSGPVIQIYKFEG